MLRNVALIIFATFAAILLTEASLRLIGFYRPPVEIPDPIAGNFRSPNFQFRYTDEGDAQVAINSYGQRDREHTVAKPRNTYRIAVLGDSFAEAYQVNRSEAFWAILEEQLNQCGAFGKNVEVLNFGVSGYGTAQELLTLRHRAWDFDPDMILLAFLTGNDIRNNSRLLEPGKLRPFFQLDDEGALVLDNGFQLDPEFVQNSSGFARWLRKVTASSRVLQLLRRSKELFRGTNERQAKVALWGSETGLDDSVYLDDPGPEWTEAWRVTEALLAQMHLEVQDRGRSFLVVTFSNGIQVTPHPEQTRNYMEALGITDIFAPDHRIEDFGKKHSFDVLTLAPALQAMARDRKVNMHGFGNSLGLGHWNQNGHRAAAALIAEYLCHGHAATAPTKTSEPSMTGPRERASRTKDSFEENERAVRDESTAQSERAARADMSDNKEPASRK